MIWLIAMLLAIIAATLLFGSLAVQKAIGYAIGFTMAMIGNIAILLMVGIVLVSVYEGIRLVVTL